MIVVRRRRTPTLLCCAVRRVATSTTPSAQPWISSITGVAGCDNGDGEDTTTCGPNSGGSGSASWYVTATRGVFAYDDDALLVNDSFEVAALHHLITPSELVAVSSAHHADERKASAPVLLDALSARALRHEGPACSVLLEAADRHAMWPRRAVLRSYSHAFVARHWQSSTARLQAPPPAACAMVPGPPTDAVSDQGVGASTEAAARIPPPVAVTPTAASAAAAGGDDAMPPLAAPALEGSSTEATTQPVSAHTDADSSVVAATLLPTDDVAVLPPLHRHRHRRHHAEAVRAFVGQFLGGGGAFSYLRRYYGGSSSVLSAKRIAAPHVRCVYADPTGVLLHRNLAASMVGTWGLRAAAAANDALYLDEGVMAVASWDRPTLEALLYSGGSSSGESTQRFMCPQLAKWLNACGNEGGSDVNCSKSGASGVRAGGEHLWIPRSHAPVTSVGNAAVVFAHAADVRLRLDRTTGPVAAAITPDNGSVKSPSTTTNHSSNCTSSSASSAATTSTTTVRRCVIELEFQRKDIELCLQSAAVVVPRPPSLLFQVPADPPKTTNHHNKDNNSNTNRPSDPASAAAAAGRDSPIICSGGNNETDIFFQPQRWLLGRTPICDGSSHELGGDGAAGEGEEDLLPSHSASSSPSQTPVAGGGHASGQSLADAALRMLFSFRNFRLTHVNGVPTSVDRSTDDLMVRRRCCFQKGQLRTGSAAAVPFLRASLLYAWYQRTHLTTSDMVGGGSFIRRGVASRDEQLNATARWWVAHLPSSPTFFISRMLQHWRSVETLSALLVPEANTSSSRASTMTSGRSESTPQSPWSRAKFMGRLHAASSRDDLRTSPGITIMSRAEQQETLRAVLRLRALQYGRHQGPRELVGISCYFLRKHSDKRAGAEGPDTAFTPDAFWDAPGSLAGLAPSSSCSLSLTAHSRHRSESRPVDTGLREAMAGYRPLTTLHDVAQGRVFRLRLQSDEPVEWLAARVAALAQQQAPSRDENQRDIDACYGGFTAVEKPKTVDMTANGSLPLASTPLAEASLAPSYLHEYRQAAVAAAHSSRSNDSAALDHEGADGGAGVQRRQSHRLLVLSEVPRFLQTLLARPEAAGSSKALDLRSQRQAQLHLAGRCLFGQGAAAVAASDPDNMDVSYALHSPAEVAGALCVATTAAALWKAPSESGARALSLSPQSPPHAAVSHERVARALIGSHWRAALPVFPTVPFDHPAAPVRDMAHAWFAHEAISASRKPLALLRVEVVRLLSDSEALLGVPSARVRITAARRQQPSQAVPLADSVATGRQLLHRRGAYVSRVESRGYCVQASELKDIGSLKVRRFGWASQLTAATNPFNDEGLVLREVLPKGLVPLLWSPGGLFLAGLRGIISADDSAPRSDGTAMDREEGEALVLEEGRRGSSDDGAGADDELPASATPSADYEASTEGPLSLSRRGSSETVLSPLSFFSISSFFDAFVDTPRRVGHYTNAAKEARVFTVANRCIPAAPWRFATFDWTVLDTRGVAADSLWTGGAGHRHDDHQRERAGSGANTAVGRQDALHRSASAIDGASGTAPFAAGLQREHPLLRASLQAVCGQAIEGALTAAVAAITAVLRAVSGGAGPVHADTNRDAARPLGRVSAADAEELAAVVLVASPTDLLMSEAVRWLLLGVGGGDDAANGRDSPAGTTAAALEALTGRLLGLGPCTAGGRQGDDDSNSSTPAFLYGRVDRAAVVAAAALVALHAPRLWAVLRGASPAITNDTTSSKKACLVSSAHRVWAELAPLVFELRRLQRAAPLLDAIAVGASRASPTEHTALRTHLLVMPPTEVFEVPLLGPLEALGDALAQAPASDSDPLHSLHGGGGGAHNVAAGSRNEPTAAKVGSTSTASSVERAAKQPSSRGGAAFYQQQQQQRQQQHSHQESSPPPRHQQRSQQDHHRHRGAHQSSHAPPHARSKTATSTNAHASASAFSSRPERHHQQHQHPTDDHRRPGRHSAQNHNHTRHRAGPASPPLLSDPPTTACHEGTGGRGIDRRRGSGSHDDDDDGGGIIDF